MPPDDFPDEGELSFEHDVFNGGDVVEWFPDVFIFDVKVSHIFPFYVSDASDGWVVEDFELFQRVLCECPALTTPEEEVDRDSSSLLINISIKTVQN